MDAILQGTINLIFSLALFINALLFIPQAIKIFKEKSALSISLWTFIGFMLTQLAAILYGIIHHDTVLVVGYLLSLISCGVVVSLALIYRSAKGTISFENILKQLPSQVYWKDNQGRYVWRNDASLNYFGFANNGESITKTDEQLYAPEDANALKEMDKETLKGEVKFTEEPRPLNSEDEKSYLTYRVPLRAKNNEILGLLGISFVNEFNKLFKRQLHLLEHIIALMPGNVYWVDRNNVYQGCNDNQAKLSGLKSREEVIGKRNVDLPWNLNASTLSDELDAINANVMETGRLTVAEEPAILADGTQLTYLSTKAPIYDQKGDIIGMVGISVNITDRKKMEVDLREAMLAAEAASRTKSEFIANISHDLRTPLTGIVTMSNDLKDRLKGTGGEQEAEWLNESGEQLLEFCNSILDTVSADNYSERYIKEECFDLRQMIQAIVHLEMPMIQSKELESLVNIDKDIPSYLIKDKSKLYRIMVNLLGNAIKFTEKGYVGIDVKLVEQYQNKVILQFCVFDSGIGIKSELQDQIFERFFRANPSYKGIYKGNGLGLYIAQKYVQLLGADKIYVESEEGKGCRFFFTLSFKLGKQKNVLCIVPEPELNSRKDIDILSAKATSKMSYESYQGHALSENAPLVLLIEDNKTALRGLELLIKKAGCRFKSVENGEEGIKFAKTMDFDLIISDIGLPGISGIEATEAIRSWEKAHNKKRVPIVALTGHAAQLAEFECLQAGMDQVLTKPANLDKIKKLLEYFVFKEKKLADNHSKSLLGLPQNAMESQTHLGADLPDMEDELFLLEQYPLFDMKVANELFEGCELIIPGLLQDMTQAITKDKAEIMAAFTDNNWQRIEELAHRVKGGAAACGVVRMRYACQYLERYRKAGHTQFLEPLYHQLIQVLDETKLYLDEWLNQNQGVSSNEKESEQLI